MSDRCNLGCEMFRWITDLFPINRSITGTGVVHTLDYFRKILPNLVVGSVASGYRACDWTVPDEWSVEEAYIESLDGVRIVDFKDNNLHIVGYSVPINAIVDNSELQLHLHSLPDQPSAIPYVTSYYERTWGFCVTENVRQTMQDSEYRCVITSHLRPGHLHYADLVVEGDTKKEIVFSSYICHPSMANNELSGPALLTAIARVVQSFDNRKYTYRFILAPETIGALVYIEKMGTCWPKDVVGAFNLTCVGDNNRYSFLPSRSGATYIDKISRFALDDLNINYEEYDFTTRGSDERQYNSPLVDISTVSLMRSKYHTYEEYHTSLDDLTFISADGLQGSFDLHRHVINILESNFVPVCTVRGEPQLGKYGLYDSLSIKRKRTPSRDYLNVLAYSDGEHDLVDICIRLDISYELCVGIATRLIEIGLLEST
jgi:aminopeptidase-like protein